MAGQHLLSYPLSFLSRYLKRLVRSLVYLPSYTWKKHQCSVCDKEFPTPSKLLLHMRVHSGEKPFVCSHCGKRFATKDNMNQHVRIHTGEHPFSCTFCPYTLLRKKISHNTYAHTQGRNLSPVMCVRSCSLKAVI